jgi:penicillin-binding protein 1A
MNKYITKIKSKFTIYNVSIFLMIAFVLAIAILGIYITYGISILAIILYKLIRRRDIIMKKMNINDKKSNTKKKTSDKVVKEKKVNKKTKFKTILHRIFLGMLIFFIIGLLSVFAFAALIVITAPEFDPNNMSRKEATTLFDKNGEVIVKLGLEKREIITYDQMPDVLVDAIVATEDARFFQHNGFDLPRFMVASLGQALGQDAGGASTLTMQVSKNNYTSNVSSGFDGVKRKFTDIYMSIFKIERNYTKEEIFEFYANQNNLGAGAYGVQQASLTYFGKDAKDLNLSEAALIAGLFQAPSAYNPFFNPEAATRRRGNVLYLMERHGYITNEERVIANAIPVVDLLNKNAASSNFQAFVDTVVEEVVLLTGKDPYIVSMDIYTTMDKEKQLYVNSIMDGTVFKWENDVVDAGIAIISNEDGSIAAIGAGRHRTGQRQFNNATMIKRQIGSTSKPLFDYAPGIENNNWSSYQLFADEPHSYTNGGSIKNWDNKFDGLLTMRVALARSRNIPALKAFQANSNKDILDFVTSVGLSPEIESGRVHEAHALGGYNGESPLSMAAAYSVFANGGFYTKPYSFTKITYRETKEEFINNPEKTRVLSSATAYIMANMLTDAAKTGLGGYSNISGRVYGAKTGTTNFSAATIKQFKLPSSAINDQWVVGTSPDYAVGVWYGYEKTSSDYYTRLFGMEHAKLFQKIGQGTFSAGSNFTQSRDVVRIEVEKESWPAMLPSANTPEDMRITELFIRGTEPTEVSSRFMNLDAVKNLTHELLANKVTLSWDTIDTPSALDQSKLEEYFRSLYQNTTHRNNALNSRILWNQENIGEVGYNIYSKDESGALSLLGFTKDNNFEYTITDNTIFVVKSTYTIFKASESSDSTLSVEFTPAVVDAVLNGEATINVPSGSTYTEQSVRVTEDGIDVTTNPAVNINRSIKKGTETVTTVTTPGTYIITYNVGYKSFSKILTRIVIVQ